MKLKINDGKYVVAVSGGVDSVVLLNMLSKTPGVELVVAHFDHGIRADSHKDAVLVANLSQKYNVPCEIQQGNLGNRASEDTARRARYEFLRQICKNYQADAIITAHHQDDVLETVMLNVVRGTRRRGLSSLMSQKDILRPMLGYTKKEIIAYAKAHNLQWREDSTNADTTIMRNWLRREIIPKLLPHQRKELLEVYEGHAVKNAHIDELLGGYLSTSHPHLLERKVFVTLPHEIAKEVVAHWLRMHNIRDFDAPSIERLSVKMKTLAVGKRLDIVKGATVVIGVKQFQLMPSASHSKGEFV